METTEPGGPPLIVPVVDSEDARLFIELSSHAADLTEARRAAELALGADEGSPFAEAKAALIGYAVVAYCRTCVPSRVLRPLTAFVKVPVGLQATHDKIRAFRNRAVAHSQSDLSTTHALGVLDPDTLHVRDVSALTFSYTLPDGLVRDFVSLIDLLDALIDEALAPVRQRLHAALCAIDRETLAASATTPKVLDKSVADFSATVTRRPYPESQTLYWELEAKEGSTPEP